MDESIDVGEGEERGDLSATVCLVVEADALSGQLDGPGQGVVSERHRRGWQLRAACEEHASKAAPRVEDGGPRAVVSVLRRVVWSVAVEVKHAHAGDMEQLG